MTPSERDELIRLAEELANGRRIDWATATSSTSPSVLRAVSQLRVIHDIRRVHALRWGPFELRDVIATGAYGEVYEAYDPTLERDVALKLLREDRASSRAQSAFVAEARKLARVRHPHVVTIHGADVHDDRAGLWMELVRGRTLEQVLAAHGPLSAHEAARIGIDLCGALAAIHAAGVVHRDVKASNVVREEGGRIVLMDMGAAASAMRDEASLGEGTPLYLSPERIAGDSAVPADDLYALGVLLYRLVAGRYPVEARTWDDLTAARARSLRDARPDAPASFVQAIDRALSAKRAERFATAGEMERALRGIAGAPARPRTARTWWSLTAALVVVGGAVAADQWVRSNRARPAAPTESTAQTPAHDPTAPLAARASLARVRADATSPLASGERIAPGDALALTVSCAESVYAYVIDEDAAGTATVLFPAPGLDRTNPLPARVAHVLPGSVAGVTKYWQVTTAGGAETITVIASRTPLREFESDIARLPQPAPGAPMQYASLSAAGMRRLRGIATLADAPRTRDTRLGDALRQSATSTDDAPGVWTWQITLHNP